MRTPPSESGQSERVHDPQRRSSLNASDDVVGRCAT